MSSSTVLASIFLIFGACSVLSGILLLVRYLQIRVLRKPPGMLIFWQCLSQTFENFLWTLSAFVMQILECGVYRIDENAELCLVHGMCAFYAFFLGLSYTICLSLEILFKIRHPLLNSYSTRSIYYHVISHLSTIALVILIGWYKETGVTSMKFCFLKEGSWGNFLVLALVCICYPTAMVISLHAIISFGYTYDISRRVYLLRYTIVMALYALGWLPMAIVQSFRIQHQLEIWYIVSWGFCSVTGLVVNLVRLSDPALMGKTKKRWKKQSVRISIRNSYVSARSSLIQQELIDFFQEVLTEVGIRKGAMSAIISLYQLQVNIRHNILDRNIKMQSHRFKASELGSESIEMREIKKQCKRHSVASYKFQVKEFYPMIFAGIRSGVGGLNYLSSLDPTMNKAVLKMNIGNRGGKSDAFIFLTYDRKLVLKSLSKKEKNLFLTNLLSGYEVRINSEESLLARVLGVYTIKTSKGLKQHIMVMQNIIASPKIIAIFDMKGSKVARKILKHNQEVPIEELPSYQTYKDLDFFLTQKQLHLSLSDTDRLLQTIKADVEMLRSHAIMDYSLLIAIAEEDSAPNIHLFRGSGVDASRVYYVGIIDFLQLYNRKKQLEGFSKLILRSSNQREDISAVDSERYAKRFLELLKRIIQSNS